MGPTQPSIQWAPAAVSLEVTRQEHEADHSPPSVSRLPRKCGNLDVSQSYGLHGLLQGQLYLRSPIFTSICHVLKFRFHPYIIA
jgi:hypothetical protein